MKDGEESGWNCGTQISFKIGCIHYSYYWSYVFDQVDHPYVRAKKHMEFIRLVATKKMIPVMVLRGGWTAALLPATDVVDAGYGGNGRED